MASSLHPQSDTKPGYIDITFEDSTKPNHINIKRNQKPPKKKDKLSEVKPIDIYTFP